jgi:hypothetical protein
MDFLFLNFRAPVSRANEHLKIPPSLGGSPWEYPNNYIAPV